MADLCTSVLLAGIITFVLFYFLSWINKETTKVVKKIRGKPDEPIECKISKIKFPALSGWTLHLVTCIFKWKCAEILKNIIMKQARRDLKIDYLRQMSIPDHPTLIPQVLPSKEQQLHQESDLKSLLKKPSNIQGFQFVSISELIEAYRSGKTTPLQVVENAMEAIEKSEKPDIQLKAFVQFNKTDALQMAQESTRRYAENKTLSLIDGVPVAIKEEIRVAGYHMRCGTVFMGQEVEEEDCNMVTKLRELGAVIIGMTNMHELGFGTTGVNPNSLHGISRNPYNLACYTGGSSGGSASAVAAGICPVAIGKDGGGSIRIPSTLCGVVGIKATFGRVTLQAPRYGCYTVTHAGPICNNVRDTAIMYALLSGRDPEYPAGMIQPEHATLEGFENLDLSDLTLGVDWAFAQCADEEVIEHFKKAVEYLKTQGANIVSIQIPELEETRIAHTATIGSEITLAVENGYPDQLEKLGKQKQQKRTTTFFQFCQAKSGILLCTDVAARGLDIPEVDWIVQFDPPDDPKEYIHRVGRTARGAHGKGHALLFLLPEELAFLRYLKHAKVPLNEYDVSSSKIANIQSQLEKLITKNYYLHKSAKEGYRSYLQAYASHQHRDIFNVNTLDLQKVAKAFGFQVPPAVNLAVHSSKGERARKRGGGGGFGTGYRNSKLTKKTKIFKHKKDRTDSRQFSR